MQLTWLVLRFATLALPLILTTEAAARTIKADYAVKIRGFLIGRATFEAEISGLQYTLHFSGQAGGIGRIFSDASTTAIVTGNTGADRLLPSEYSHTWIEGGETERVTMQFSGRALSAMTLDPPRNHPQRYVPLTAETNADAGDLLSAFLWRVDKPTDASCNRTFRLVDGRRRFDIALTFTRMDEFATSDGSFSTPVAVCAIHYSPVAGHRIGKPDNSILNTGDAEVWIAPFGEGFALPVRIQMQSRVGRILLETRSISSN
jgi:hypothetical protein